MKSTQVIWITRVAESFSNFTCYQWIAHISHHALPGFSCFHSSMKVGNTLKTKELKQKIETSDAFYINSNVGYVNMNFVGFTIVIRGHWL